MFQSPAAPGYRVLGELWCVSGCFSQHRCPARVPTRLHQWRDTTGEIKYKPLEVSYPGWQPIAVHW